MEKYNIVVFRFYLFFLLSLFASSTIKSQDYNLIKHHLIENKNFEVFPRVKKIYNIEVDTVKLIGTLLKKKGYKKFNKKWDYFTDIDVLNKYLAGKSSRIPEILPINGVVSLYLISSLYLRDYEFCCKMNFYKKLDNDCKLHYDMSGYKIYKDGTWGKPIMIKKDRKIFREIYNQYLQWYKKLIKYNTLQEARRGGLVSPLENFKFQWSDKCGRTQL